jgi:UDP-glucose 4-epimerase
MDRLGGFEGEDMAVLVTGGAGYIGSVFVEVLRQHGEQPVVLDDLSRGHRAALAPEVPFYQGRAGDVELVQRILREQSVDACVHFAALIFVGESVQKPAEYFENNFCQAASLFHTLVRNGVKRVVFSSTAAVYGEPREVPIPETHPQWPVNPYGWSKFYVERMLESFDAAYGLRFAALRYFNASGALPGRGEDHDPENHLIPNVLFAAMGKRPHISLFGADYPTPDGTAIRDYIHVGDLGAAHIKALEYLRRGGASQRLNLGTGRGYSVKEVVDVVERVTGRKVPVKLESRRAGDPARLVAQAEQARKVLGWEPESSDLETIVRTAWEWHRTHPNGYGDRK